MPRRSSPSKPLAGRLLAATAALALVLAPALADARPGGGGSSGSRGARTFSPPAATRTVPESGVRPMDRSMAQPGRPATPATPGAVAPARGGLFGGGFAAGMMGGLLGVGLGGLLFGNGMFGGISGLGGILGLLLQIGLVVLLVRFVMKLIRNRSQPAMAGGPNPNGAPNGPLGAMPANAQARQMHPAAAAGLGGGMAPAAPPVPVGPADFQAFEGLLRDINAAWSRRDEAALARLATPEMTRYFQGDLRDLAARNWHNETRDVRLEQGDLSESWREGSDDYATVAMRFSMVDVTRDLTSGAVVEGDPERRQTTAELWTFIRQHGDTWRLSAIQQPR